MWRGKGSFSLSGAAKAALPTGRVVVAVDAEGAVTISQKEATATHIRVLQKRDVRRQEALAVPGGGGRDVFALGIDPRLHRGLAVPDDLTLKRQLGKRLHALIPADVEKLLAALAADLDAMAAPLKLAAEGPHKHTLRIKHEDRRMILQLSAALVDHVEVAAAIESHVVGGLPGEAVGELGEVVLHAEGVLALAQNRLTGQSSHLRHRRSHRHRRCRSRHGRTCHQLPPRKSSPTTRFRLGRHLSGFLSVRVPQNAAIVASR